LGAPSVDGGKCCASLSEVRDNIDRPRSPDHRADGRARKIRREAAASSDPAASALPRASRRSSPSQDDRPRGRLAETVAERSYRAMIAAFEITSGRSGRAAMRAGVAGE